MSDRMRPIPFEQLMNRVLEEHETENMVFSVRKQYKNQKNPSFLIFGEEMEASFGVAAGPHTQMAQNIIAAYMTGARFFELKTVQILDGEDLPVSKPCILVQQEGYNVEWSTELRVKEAMEEYIKAWYALKLIAKEFELGNPQGFVFNMSVGYDLEGIRSEKIDLFIEGLKNAAELDVWKECEKYAVRNLGRFKKISKDYLDTISPKVCSSVTLSTLHGCPAHEIERISEYLINEKNLHTYIKCNPTLLGYKFARSKLDEMGYEYLEFDDHHFREDLQYEEASAMFRRLMGLAGEKHLEFGVKLTNTFPVKIMNRELPGDEMYMSGKALYPLTIALADKLAGLFDGKLRISLSGGADCFNIDRIIRAGIWPVTMATNLLKPGGYERMVQIAETLVPFQQERKGEVIQFEGVDRDLLHEISQGVAADIHYRQSIKPMEPFKSEEPLPITDCFQAPCEDACPIHQDIPDYIRLTGEGRYKEALALIMEKNPLPFITGTICNHRCMSRCTRNFYEESVRIRDVKLEAAKKGYEETIHSLQAGGERKDIRAAIVGGGAAGMAAAYFLARAGAGVTIFEKEKTLGGIIRHVVPEFRIAPEIVEKDVSFLRRLGVKIRTGMEVKGKEELDKLGFTHVILTIGASRPVRMEIQGSSPLYAIEFLKSARKGTAVLGKKVIVVGAGNTAMDVARAAKRVSGVEKVTIVYRRDKRWMPADEEEFILVREEGIEFLEKLNPVSYAGRHLKCEKMSLGNPDASGRKRPSGTNEFIQLEADNIIVAAGELPDMDYIRENFGESVMLAGDCNKKARTVVEAIRDAAEVAGSILNSSDKQQAVYKLSQEEEKDILEKKGILVHAEKTDEARRCLRCSYICENCIDVCPNRANVEIKIGENEMPQILHLDDLCNECGNCAVFCPLNGHPYKDKLTLFSSQKNMEESENPGFYIEKETGRINKNKELILEENEITERMIQTLLVRYRYLI